MIVKSSAATSALLLALVAANFNTSMAHALVPAWVLVLVFLALVTLLGWIMWEMWRS